MFKQQNVVIGTALVIFGMLGVSPVQATEPPCYTPASLQGSWSVIATYGASVAVALGDRSIEEDGTFTGTFVLNGPTAASPTGARTITTGTQMGTYTVNCDGRGTVTRTLTASNGVTTTQVDDFIITNSAMEHGQLIATAIADAQRTPSALVPGGIFVTRRHSRLSNGDKLEP